jgi:hypothetical protein
VEGHNVTHAKLEPEVKIQFSRKSLALRSAIKEKLEGLQIGLKRICVVWNLR